MIRQKHLLLCATALTMAAGTAPVSAAPWVKGFVAGTHEYAFRYGGRSDFTRGAEIEPGVDCPHGNTVHFANDEQTKVAVARQKFRSQQEIDWIAKPPGLDQVRAPVLTRFHIWNRALAYRAWQRGIETYVNPWAADDPGQPQVVSKIGDGFDLDGKIKPTDFISPDGERGVDNNLYRAWGCDAPWRGNGNATLDLRANDKMQEGLYTIVFRISGTKDPMNDDNVTVEIGYSPDKLVKDARGGIAQDYSYRILQPMQYTKLKGRIVNGVVETEQVPELHSPRLAWFYDQNGDTNFRNGKIKIKMAPDGLTANALVGGYRNWRDLYTENTFAQDGGQQGIREHEDHVSLYYALRRNADGMYNEKTGKYDGISSVYRMKLTSAYVVDPDKPMAPTIVVGDEDRKAAFEAIRYNTILGMDTRVPQPVPPGTSEAALPSMENDVKDLPSKDFFLKTLDRPHYADEDANGMPPWIRNRRRRGAAPPATPPAEQKPQQQVLADKPPVLASAEGNE